MDKKTVDCLEKLNNTVGRLTTFAINNSEVAEVNKIVVSTIADVSEVMYLLAKDN